jgi:Protein of unknown function (DUF551)
MSEWISVKDKLPDHHKSVLVITKTDAQAVVIFLNDKDTNSFLEKYFINVPDDYKGHAFCSQEIRGNVLTGVTHWMPLPEKPRGCK